MVMFLYHLSEKIFPTQVCVSSITISLSWLCHVIVQFFLSRHGCTFSGLLLEFLCWPQDLIFLNTTPIAQKFSYLTFPSLLIHLNFLSKHETFSLSHQNPTLHSLSPYPLSSGLTQHWLQFGYSSFLPVLLPFIFHWFILHNCPLQA